MYDSEEKQPKWMVFDLEWYRNRYKSFSLLIQDIYQGDVFAYHSTNGYKVGNSPNPYFDEKWYLTKYYDVKELIKKGKYTSGFDHYCKIGFKDHSPHWLFSETFYKKHNPEINDLIGEGKPYINGYDHYLRVGDRSCLKGSFFFNPCLYLSQKENLDEITEYGPYQYVLTNDTDDFDKFRLSWFFDPKWYGNTYSKETLKTTNYQYLNLLHHYLSNPTPTLFSPLEQFSEQFYLENYQDLSPSILMDGHGLFRNGYEHFIVCGCKEKRKPLKDFDYNQFSDEIFEKIAKDNLYLNIFEYWVAQQDLHLLNKFMEIQKRYSNDKDKIENSFNIQKSVKNLETVESGDVSDSISTRKNEKGFSVIEDNISNIEKEIASSDYMPIWQAFDEKWYVHKYDHVTSKMKALEVDSVEEYYKTFGCFEGHSPNPYFDEEWYLQKYPDVKLMVDCHQFTSGFQHYCKEGYHTHDPHWLFSEKYYKKVNPHLTNENLERNGFVNGYDHFLKVGDIEGNSGSLFFNSNFFIGKYQQAIKEGLSPYQHYLKYLDEIDGKIQVSWYFDPEWYAQNYPEITKAISEGTFNNYIHHYLVNSQAFNFNPNAWFDESFYDQKYKSQLENVQAFKKYRNGYAHFIYEGIQLLWDPCEEINLQQYAADKAVKQDIQKGLYPNAYIRLLASGTNYGGRNKDLSVSSQSDSLPIQKNIENDKNAVDQALWAKFDGEWYIKTYPDLSERMKNCGLDDVEIYYNQVGSILGHSPNPYFDEEWYLQRYPELRKNIDRGAFKSGFEHYCNQGYLTHDPHWLFSTHYYLKNNADFIHEVINDSQYINAYDHYLKKGDGLRRTGSLLFDPSIYQQACYEREDVKRSQNPYRNFLYYLSDVEKNTNVSLYFDTSWYLEKYPDVKQKIADGEYLCALHHYCLNETPKLFNPSPWFEEEFYLDHYKDINQAIESTASFRNGYDHFIHYGALELRSPRIDISLHEYYLSGDIRDKVETGIFRDAFAAYVFEQKLDQWINKQPDDSHYRLTNETKESRTYFKKKSRLVLPSVVHEKLDFSYNGQADICVIMLMHNNLTVTLTALASLRSNFNGNIQLLLGDNHSIDDSQFIQGCLIGASVNRFPYNFGFGKACNILMEDVDAPIVIFLNNDINLLPGAIDALCKRLTSADNIGAVGGKIIHPDGLLQEAGQIIWRDGTTTGYLRGKDPLIPEANFVRDVDYCSAAMLAVKSKVLKELNGFSPIYYPAYFEDTDFCVRMIKAGYRIVYDPNAVVEHMEYCSSNPIISSGLIKRNHRLFAREHADFLRFQSPRHSDNILIARQRRNINKRILFIEDRVPLKHLGSGYIRSNDIIFQMSELGYEVTVYPINYFYPHVYQIYSSMPDTVEVLFNHTVEHLRDFFKERAGYYDLVWIGRTHNLNRILPMMGEASRYLPQEIILDTEVVATPRTRLQAKLLEKEIDENFQQALEEELSCAKHCQEIVAVNEIDANYIRQAGFNNVDILGHSINIRKSQKEWKERKNILFVGALHDDQAPNYDSLKWFITSVMPILIDKMGSDLTFSIAGYVNPSVDISALINYPDIDFLGMVPDLSSLYDDHRVYIAPTRFAGGIPYKLHEAASYGIPIVASNLLVEQLGWQDERDILAASTDNPEFFASQIIRLYQTEELWNQLRQNALDRIARECNRERFKEQLQSILSKVILHRC